MKEQKSFANVWRKVAWAVIATLGASAFASVPWNDATEALSSLSAGTGLKVKRLEATDDTLTSGIYYVAEDLTFEGKAASSCLEPGGSGLTVATNSTVYLYIPQGVTLTATGGKGYDSPDVPSRHKDEFCGLEKVEESYFGIRYYTFKRNKGRHRELGEAGVHTNIVATGGGAGICVPANSKLVVFGDGKLSAHGGEGGTAGHGAIGAKTSVYVGSWCARQGHGVYNSYWDNFTCKNNAFGTNITDLDGNSLAIAHVEIVNPPVDHDESQCDKATDDKGIILMDVSVAGGGAGGNGAGGGGAGIGSCGTTGGLGTDGARCTDEHKIDFPAKGEFCAEFKQELAQTGEMGVKAEKVGLVYVMLSSEGRDIVGGMGGEGYKRADRKSSGGSEDGISVWKEPPVTQDAKSRKAVNEAEANLEVSIYFRHGQNGGHGGTGGQGAAIGQGGQGGQGGHGGASGGFIDSYYMGCEEAPTGGEPAGDDGEKGADGEAAENGRNYPYNTVRFLGASAEEALKTYDLTAGTMVPTPMADENGVPVAFWEVTVAATNLPPEMAMANAPGDLAEVRHAFVAGSEIATVGLYGNAELRKILNILDDPEAANAVKIYDGEPTNITVTVTNDVPDAVCSYTLTPDDPESWQTNTIEFTEVKIDGGGVGSNQVWYVVKADGFVEKTNSAWVTILKRPVTISSADATKPYDGTPLVCHEAAVTNGLDFVSGDVTATNFTGTITTVGSATNMFDVVFADGKSDDYELTCEFGTLTVTKLPIVPDDPGDPEDPDPDPDPGKPELFARNVVKDYDGAGTNVTAKVYGLVGDDTVEVRYALDPEGPFVAWDDVQVTNVVRDADGNVASQKVWVAALDSENYFAATGFAWVVVQPRAVELTSGSETWSYDGLAHSNLEVRVTSGGFVAGEGIATNGFATITEVGEADNAFDVTWLEGTRETDYALSVVTGRLAVVKNNAMLAARLAWVYDANCGTYFARLGIACTNGYAERIESVAFVMEDRAAAEDPSRLEVALWDSTLPWQKTDPNSRAAADCFSEGGKAYRRFVVTATIPEIEPGEEIPLVCGPTDAQLASWWSMTEAARNAVRTGTPEVMYRPRDLSVNLGDYYAFVVWRTNGTDYWLPVAGGEVTDPKTGKTVRTGWYGETFEARKGPVSAAKLNLSRALGLVLEETAVPTCALTEFATEGATVSGRIETAVGDAMGAPTCRAAVILLGTDSLDGAFREIGRVRPDEQGRFSAEDGGCRFFKVKVSVDQDLELLK